MSISQLTFSGALNCFVLGAGVATNCWSQEDTTGPEKSAAVVAMQHEIEQLDVSVRRDSVDIRCDLHPDPILRYSDPAREFPDATLWLWTVDGAPCVVSKLEQARRNKALVWQYCLSGASNELGTVRWPDNIVWKATRPSLKWHPLAWPQSPRGTASGRLIQFRELARSFAGTIINHDGGKEEMRLLPQPLYRYAGQSNNILDGVIFGLASNGTNPDGLLFLQILRSGDSDKLAWQFGCIGLSADLIELRHDGVIVFNHDGAIAPGHHGHWLWSVVPIE